MNEQVLQALHGKEVVIDITTTGRRSGACVQVDPYPVPVLAGSLPL
jgi:hypothetical protein